MDDLDIYEDLKAFLTYVDGKETLNEFVQELKEEIHKVKNNENWRRDYMMQHIRDQLKIEEGKEIGDISRIISQISKKVQKSKSLDTIADELECTPGDISHLYDAILKCGVGASVEDVLKEIKSVEC